MKWRRFVLMPIVCSIVSFVFVASTRAADCRKIEPSKEIVARKAIAIDRRELKQLQSMRMTSEKIFDAMKFVSIPETNGCWSGASGNFDNQIISIGILQWNYGKNSLQPLLLSYRNGFRSASIFDQEIRKLMPAYGKLIFSRGCLRYRPEEHSPESDITDECRTSILALQHNNTLNAAFKQELDALFESDAMIQVQADKFIALLESVQDDLDRIFPERLFPIDHLTDRRIKWAIDTKVQQGYFPGDVDIKRVREIWSKLSRQEKRAKLRSLLLWYEGLSNSADQGGVRLDWNWNVDKWRKLLDSNGWDEEQADLLNLTFLRSRIAGTQSGYWQANAFQRRATIIFGVGSIGGDRRGGD
jgi:hypothetical protein